MPPPGITVLSWHPTSGLAGTKVSVKVSSQYDLFSMAFFLQFGSEKCSAQGSVTRDAQDSTGLIYTCSVDAPQHMVTGCNSNNVPLALLIEGPAGEEISRTSAGSFQYLEGSGDDITRPSKALKHESPAPAQAVDQPSTSPKSGEPQLASEAPTNTYDYPPQQTQYGNNFPPGNADMITAYRSTSFTDPHYHRRPAAAWSPYPSTLGSSGRSPALDPSMGRQSMGPLPVSSSTGNGTPQLIRTSTIASGVGNNSSYHPVSLYSSKAMLKIVGKLDSMAENWSQQEWESRRRLVLFRKSQQGSTLTTTFRAVTPEERPPNSICISCIWWQERTECYVTSVDTISLLEQLVASPGRFTVEEKNRIRRNLEGFHPLTVSKAKADSEEFFKIIMAFPNPKPRNIEKDVKVFPWKILEPALKKIIGKYSASPGSTIPPSNLMTPVSTTYAPLPTPPGHNFPSAAGHGDPHGQYANHSQHHESIPSPRSLPGSHPPWAPYSSAAQGYSATTSRTLSPGLRHPSPQQPPQAPLRINTTPLPAVSTYDTRTTTTGGYGSTGLHTPLSHHHSTATPPRWEPASSSTYPEGYSSVTTTHHAHTPQSVYSPVPYGEAPPRA